jgi:molecular chaperone DnaK
MNEKILEIYRSIANRLILQTAHGLRGQAKSALDDFDLFRRTMIEPAWNQLPATLQSMGRDKLRWEDVMRDLVKELFVSRPDGQLVMRGDAPEQLDRLVQRVVAAPAGMSAAPVPVVAPLAAAVIPALPVAPATPMVAKPVTLPPQFARAVPAAPPAPTASSSKIALGIDLGTTYSVVAYLDAAGRPTSITNTAGDLTTPSVVLFDDEGPIVGKEANMAAPMEPDRIAVCVKRDMGAKEYRKPVNGVRLPPEVISSIILKSLLNDARRRLGGDVAKAVITVPAYFDELRRRATVDAGRLAGLEVLDIINEPTAAALAFGYQTGFLDPQGKAKADKPINVLVYDLGGGTFDVTIVEIFGTSFKALATDGDVCLGGKDFDEAIVNLAAEKFYEAHQEDPRKNLSCFMEMWNAAEAAKKTLSERTKTSLYVNCHGKRIKVEVSREEFEDLTAPLVSRTKTTTEIVLRQSGLTWGQIDRVLLVGGSSRMPMIGAMLRELSGKEPDRSISPDEAVAHGAALYANLLLKKSGAQTGAPAFSITNINSHSLGIVGVDPATGRKRNQILIPKNTALPRTITRIFKTNKPNQSAVVIRVVEGESERPEACIQVGVCKIDNLPPNLPQGTPVQVSYAYNENGQLEVTGQVAGADAVRTMFQRENQRENEQLAMWSGYLAAVRE